MDPLHEIGGTDVAWTLGNTSEALPGVATALSWTFFGPACEAGMRRGFVNLGALRRDEEPIPADVGERFTAAVHGRMAGNIDLMARMAERLPGIGPEKVEEQLFGEVRDVPRAPTRRRYPVVAARMPVELLTAPRRLRATRAATHAWWARTVPGLASDAAGPDAARAALRTAAELFARNMALHTTVSMIGSGVFEEIEALAARAGDGHAAGALVTGHGSVEETRIAADLWRVSRDELPLEEFLRHHGWQGPDAGQLHQRVWRENPEAVQRLVTTYRGVPDTRSPATLAQRQRAAREAAEAQLLAALPTRDRLRARALLALAARWIGARETGKAGYVTAVDAARAAARSLGRDLARRGLLDDPDDVVHLTVAELTGPGDRDLRELAAQRRARREELLVVALPESWVGVPEVTPRATAEPIEDDGEHPGGVTGVGVNPGVVEGLARVVLDPNDAELEDGEVLVCATTDPSWVSLFVPAAAVVIDIGGHMSHGAIVARELGLPCVINTRTGTRAIRTGDRLRVDGGTGVVEVLGRPAPVD